MCCEADEPQLRDSSSDTEDHMTGTLSGKAAIVAGGGSGIGRAIALALAQAGADVCIADMDAGRGQSVAGEITRGGGSAHAMTADVSDGTSVRSMIDATARHFSRLDILVNNAVLHFVPPTPDYRGERWALLLRVLPPVPFLSTTRSS